MGAAHNSLYRFYVVQYCQWSAFKLIFFPVLLPFCARWERSTEGNICVSRRQIVALISLLHFCLVSWSPCSEWVLRNTENNACQLTRFGHLLLYFLPCQASIHHFIREAPQTWPGVDVSRHSSCFEHPSAKLNKVRILFSFSFGALPCTALSRNGMDGLHDAFKAKQRFPQTKCFSAIYVLFFLKWKFCPVLIYNNNKKNSWKKAAVLQGPHSLFTTHLPPRLSKQQHPPLPPTYLPLAHCQR